MVSSHHSHSSKDNVTGKCPDVRRFTLVPMPVPSSLRWQQGDWIPCREQNSPLWRIPRRYRGGLSRSRSASCMPTCCASLRPKWSTSGQGLQAQSSCEIRVAAGHGASEEKYLRLSRPCEGERVCAAFCWRLVLTIVSHSFGFCSSYASLCTRQKDRRCCCGFPCCCSAAVPLSF